MAEGNAQQVGQAARRSALCVASLFVIEGADLIITAVTHAPVSRLDAYGIVPRTMGGLVGILFSPLLHANLAHLLANATPLFILLTLLFWDRRYRPGWTLTLIWLVSGLGTWLIGRGHATHIGASSLIYGLVAYLVLAGFLMKSWRSLLIALLVLFFYGGIFYGILPRSGPISWEGHLCGAAAGLWAAHKNFRRTR
jgi:membrane associated rhomboid family serine protease